MGTRTASLDMGTLKGHEGPHVECTEHGVVENALDREWKGLYFRPGSVSVVWGNSFVSQPPNTF